MSPPARSTRSAPIRADELASARQHLLLRQLFVVFSALRDELFEGLTRSGHPGLTMQHSLLLRNLPWEGTSMADLVRSAGASRQAIARIARDLEARGYLVIAENPADARGVTLAFSRRGLVLAKEIVRHAKAVESRVERILGAEAMPAFRAHLARLQRELAPPAAGRRARRTHTR